MHRLKTFSRSSSPPGFLDFHKAAKRLANCNFLTFFADVVIHHRVCSAAGDLKGPGFQQGGIAVIKLPSSFTAVVFMAIPVALLLIGFYAGVKLESGAAAEEKLKLQEQHTEQLAAAFKDYQAKIEAQRKRDKEVIDVYLAEMAKVDSRYRELTRTDRLRLPRSVCDPDPVPTSSPGESRLAKGVAPTVVLPERVEADLRQLTRAADEVTAQCRALLIDLVK